MKHNQIIISVELIDTKGEAHKASFTQMRELPVPKEDDAGYGQLAIVLRAFQRELYQTLEKAGVITRTEEGVTKVNELLRASDVSEIFNESLREAAKDIDLPFQILAGQPKAGIDPDPQSTEPCRACRGHGYLQSSEPTETTAMGQLVYEKIDCPNCDGTGRVGA